MNQDKAEALARLRPYVERARNFSGWDFANLGTFQLDPGPPWDYEQLAHTYGRAASSALDMGTGGGEFIAHIRDDLPAMTVATEEWEVNAPVAKQRLSPLGIPVVRCKSQRLPFQASSFDLVLNRHEDLNPADVARVLRPGGRVMTQQVGRSNWRELKKYFPRKTDFGDLRGDYARGFQEAGLRVIQNAEHDYRVAFPTLGAVVYMLLVTPWTIPGFDVEADLDGLLALEADRSTEAGIVLTENRFLIVAEKPAE